MTAGFLLAVLALVVAIVAIAPEYAKPVVGAALAPDESGSPAVDASVVPTTVPIEVPTSKPPNKLKGYRWPVRGGMVAKYYDYDREGRFVVDGRRIHAGIVITWFVEATVKAAHKGTVVAAGRDWADEMGYDGPLDEVDANRKSKSKSKSKAKPSLGVVIDDGNGYRSIYSEIQDVSVKVGDKVKAGQPIGGMSRAEGRQMMRYRLIRSDGPWMKVHTSDRNRGYPKYAREPIDPLAVLKLDANKKPSLEKRRPPADPPRLSDY